MHAALDRMSLQTAPARAAITIVVRFTAVVVLIVLWVTQAFAWENSQRTVDLSHFDAATAWNSSLSTYNRSLDFLDNDTVVVSLVYDNPVPGLSDRRNARSGPHLSAIQTIDAVSGAVIAKRLLENAEFGTQTSVFGIETDRVIVRLRNRIIVLDRQLQQVWELPSDAETYLQVSADRRNFYLWSAASNGSAPTYRWRAFASANFEPKQTLTLSAQPLSAIGTNVLAAHGAAGVYLYQGDSTERLIRIDAQTTTCRPGPRPKRLTSRGILVDCNGILVLADLHGRAMAERWLENKQMSRVEASANGSEIAVAMHSPLAGEKSQGVQAGMGDAQIAILDGTTLKPVFHFAPMTESSFLFALSPDGTRLAWLSGSTLIMIDIPAVSETTPPE